MFEDKIKNNLKEDEELVIIVRKYPLVFFGPILITAIFIIAPFFFLYPLFHAGWWGVALFFIILIFGIIYGLRQFIIYSFNVFVITNKRIIDINQRGFFDRVVSESRYDKIQDISLRIKGILQTFFHYGSVIIQTASKDANLELEGVKNPAKIQEIIYEIQREVTEKNREKNPAVAELLKAIENIKQGSSLNK